LALGAVAARSLGRSLRAGPGELRRLALVDIARLTVLRPAVLAFLATFAQFSVWLLIPFYLVSARAIGASLGGVLFTLSPLGTALAAPLAGWAADRLGTRWPIVIGLGIEVAGLVIISRLTPDSALVAVAVGLLLVGFGVGVFHVPNLAEMMAAFPRGQQGVAGGLAFLGRALGSAAGVQVTAALFDARSAAAGFMSAFQSAFVGAALVAGLAALIALGPALVRGRGPRLAL
jgi:MFS family permease